MSFPNDWYWFIGSDLTQVYSSARGNFFPSSDADYQAWLLLGDAPTVIASKAELGEVLAQYLLRPVDADVLDAYKTTHASSIVAAVIFKILFNHENRLRAIERNLSLNGSPANLTANQAVAAVKALM